MRKRLLAICLFVSMFLSLLPFAQGAGRGVSLTTDKAFFAKLNLNRSGLESVKNAVDKGDYTTAKKALLSYYQNAFASYEAEPFSGASASSVFMAMNDVWAFSENYITGITVTSTNYEPYTLDLSSNLNGIYVLDQIYATTDGVGVATSESSNPPELALYSSNGTLLKTITAIEDTAVRPGKDLSAGLGSSTVMFAKHWPDTKNHLPYSSSSTRCYVRFDTTQIPSNAKTAKLTLYCKRSPGNADKVLVEDSLYLCVFSSYCTNWSEDSLTWDSLVSGNYVGHYSYNGLSGGFDWKKPKGTPSEWLNYNTRFYEVRSLVLKGTQATEASVKDSYMNKAKELVLDFINDAGANTPANRALEPANRLIEFPFIYKHLVCGGYVTPDENVKMLSWLYDDTTDQYNGAYTIFSGATATPKSNLAYTNWGLWHLTGFYSAISYFPEFSESSSWRSVYDARLGVVMGGIIKEDGSYNEVTFGYPGSVISWCSTLKSIMNQFGDNSANAAMFTEKMLLLTKYLVDCSMPNGKPPFWGEGGPSATLNAVNTTLAGLTEKELQTDLAKYLQNYKNNNYGLALDTMAQYDGIQVVTDRTGWDSTDSMIFMNAKSAGSHSHRDALSLLLYYGGRTLLSDTGMTSYDSAHQHFAFQRSSTRSHNTIEIDGIAQTLGTMVDDGANQGKIDIRGNSAVSTITSWSTASNPNRSSLKVVGTTTTNATHSTTFTHSRAVSYVKELGSILVVTDKVVPGDTATHSYTLNWHTAPYSNPTIAKDSALTGSTAFSTGPNLIIAQGGTTGITASLQTGYDASAPATPTKYFEYKKTASGTVTYQTILYPVDAGETATVVPKKLSMSNTTDAQALAMEVAITDSGKPKLSTLVHYHSFEATPSQRSFGSYSTNSATAMLALNGSGKITFASLAGGSSIGKGSTIVLQSSGTLEDLTACYEAGVLELYSEDIRARGMDFVINFSGQTVTEVLLNDQPMEFVQKSDGTVETHPAYVLLDFTEDSMASLASQWDGLRSTVNIDQGKGILSGSIAGGDPNIRMNSTAESLGYKITAGDVIEIRMKTKVSEGTNKGIQVFFRDKDTTSYSETYSCRNHNLLHATGRYYTIQLPFASDAAYMGSIIDSLRVDMLSLGSSDTVTAEYEIDYIYLGPTELAPSATAKTPEYLYFNFGNKTMDQERYDQETYGWYSFDLTCWHSNPNRNSAPVIDNEAGTLSMGILKGNTHSYVQTTDLSKSLTSEPLYYLPKAGDVVQVRLRFRHCEASSGDPKLLLFCIRDDMGEVLNEYFGTDIDPEKILSGEYMVLEFPVSNIFAAADCINSIRLTFNNIQDDGSGESRIVIDYVYVGTEEMRPMQNKLYFGFENRPEDRERYSMNTYGGFNFDTGCWGVNTARANLPVPDPEQGTLSVTIPEGSTNPYFQTTTGVNSLTTMPLTYIPGEADMVQVRVKFANCTGSSPKLCLYYIKDDSKTVTSVNSNISLDKTLLAADEYAVVTFAVPADFSAAKVINAIRISLAGVKDDGSGKGKITFDYIYVGPEEELPTARHEVKFLNGDGSVLQTVLVYDGETATYSGKEPVKEPTASKHYIFTGWNSDLTKVTQDLTVSPVFTEKSHSFIYSEVDLEEHKLSCACGYETMEAHIWGTATQTTVPTCTAQGVLTSLCALCSAEKTERIPAVGHTVVTDQGVAPTCTQTGLTEGYHCSVCNTVLTAQEVVPAKGHAVVTDEAVFATCTTTGLTEGKHCSVCNTVLTAQEVVPAKGHTVVTDQAIAPTCTAGGLTEGKHCSVCNMILVARQMISPTGHEYSYSKIDVQLHLITCLHCDYIENAPHSYIDGRCICGAQQIVDPVLDGNLKLSHSLNLASDISVNFVVPKTMLAGFDMDTVYVESTVDVYEGNLKVGTQVVQIPPVDNGYTYYFTLNGLTAVQMNNRISS
ncbi:MAG: heparinase II/III family protein, partial [Oscillospiraceae bacterium]|nr:heparinase II/III family protein [Oscillospiraceae bacterium]